MALYEVKCKSFLGADTRIQVVKERSPKKINLVRDSKFETNEPEDVSAVREASDKSRKARKSRNNNRLSNNARRILQRIGGAVSAAYSPECSIFLTGTFPGDSSEVQTAIASQAGWIVSRLKAWIYKKIGANVAYYVWEFQKRGTLHLHYVVLMPNKFHREWILREFRTEWIRLLRGASERSECNLFLGRKNRDFEKELHLLRIDAQECYKSAASYLSKYLSKSKGSDCPAPCRMWGATKEARTLVALHCISVSIPSLKLHVAAERASQLDSWSDTEEDKRRFWRHRFSQGFTILLYNDTFRVCLSEMQEMQNHERIKPYQGKAVSLWRYLGDKGMQEPLMKAMSPPGWRAFARLMMPSERHFQECSIQETKEGLIEARTCISIAGMGNYRTRNEARNRLAAIILELPSE